MTAAIVAVAALAWLALVARIGLVGARMFQIEEYEAPRLFRWGWSRSWAAHRSVLVAAVPVALATVAAVAGGAATWTRATVAVAWLAGLGAAHLAWRWLPPKKELVFTARLRRLLGSASALAIALAAGICLVMLLAPAWVGGLVAALASIAVTTASLALLVAGNIVNRPVEARLRRGFLRRARARLARFDPLVIAVTGSYGKTSTKHILAHLLEPYGSTLATPKSFNTLMGVSKTVNDVLEAEHRTFLVEMDAYAPGEIASICALVHPRHAVLTSVGPQHLERFGSVERIGAALYEAVEALPPAGFLVVYAGDAESAALAGRARADGREVVAYGLDGERDGLDVVAADVRVTGSGSSFTWRWAARGLGHELSVPLLGRHQVLNVTAALATVELLGLPLEEALGRVTTLRPVDHRLQPVATANSITVIDDSYNANPVGVHNGLEVLAEVPARSRILVTPGLVELGSVEDAENRRYGEHAALVCDHVILVDSRPARAVHEGLRLAGMADARIHVVRTLAEATAVISRVAAAGDAVLFANDLPDTYLGAA